MIDFDNIDLNEVLHRLSRTPNFTYSVYKTYGGYHAFLINHILNHSEPMVKKLLDLLECDYYYYLFSNKHGFKVRLSPKLGRDETKVATYVADVGNCKSNDKCIDMLKIHDEYLNIKRKYN